MKHPEFSKEDLNLLFAFAPANTNLQTLTEYGFGKKIGKDSKKYYIIQ